MPTDEERLHILKMIEEGKITAEQGAELLVALKNNYKPQAKPLPQRHRSVSGRSLRVHVTDMTSGKRKATINLPLFLMDVGLDIASRYAPDVAFDGLVDAINEGASGKLIDVVDEKDGEHVEVFFD